MNRPDSQHEPMALPANGIVLYDYMAVNGGAEKLTQTLMDSLPGADLCTAYVNPEAWPKLGSEAGRVIDLAVKPDTPVWRIVKVIRAFEQRCPDLDGYTWALFSGMYAPIAVKHRTRRRNYLYCHTIPRFCFDLREHYMRQIPRYARPAFALLIRYVSRKYRESLARMDLVIANSENVRGRLQKYLGCDAVVVHPPIDTDNYSWLGDGDYYLSLARLEDLKRVDVIIRAFLEMPEKKLVIASGGSQFTQLRRIASSAANICFTDWLPEVQLRELLGNARATIYVPVDEDFGMSPVESMAAGKPVIGVAEGGLLETIVDGETGVLIREPLTPLSLRHAVYRLESLRPSSMRTLCEQRAGQYSRTIFLKKMHALLGTQHAG